MKSDSESIREWMTLLESQENLQEIGPVGKAIAAGALALGLGGNLGTAAAQAQPTSTVSQQQHTITADNISSLLGKMATVVAGMPDGPQKQLWQGTVTQSTQAWNRVKNRPELVAAVLDQINGTPTNMQHFSQAPLLANRMAQGEVLGTWNSSVLGGSLASIQDFVRQSPRHAAYLDSVRTRR
jgi:hypothetical protein